MFMKQAQQMFLQVILLSTFCAVFGTPSTQVSATSHVTTASKVTQPSHTTGSSISNSVSSSTSSSTGKSTSTATSYSVILSTKTPTTHPTTKASTTAKPKGEGRKFDGLSFFGGVILGATICVILFFALKYYRAKKRSYHSL